MFTYGFYQIGVGNRERREAKEEKILARAVIVPYLQAEEDRRFVRAWTAKKENDKAIMAEVRGWDADAADDVEVDAAGRLDATEHGEVVNRDARSVWRCVL